MLETITVTDDPVESGDHTKLNAIANSHNNDNSPKLIATVNGTADELSADDNLNNLASTDEITFECTTEAELSNITTILGRTVLEDGCITFATPTHQITGELSEFASYANGSVSITSAFDAASTATSNNVPLKLIDENGIAVGDSNNNIIILTSLLNNKTDFEFTITKIANDNGLGSLSDEIIENFTSALNKNGDSDNVTIDFGIIDPDRTDRLDVVNALLDKLSTSSTGSVELSNDDVQDFAGTSSDNFTITTSDAISIANALDLVDMTAGTITYTHGVTGVYSAFDNGSIDNIKEGTDSFSAVVTNAISVDEANNLNDIAGVTAAPQKITDEAGNLTATADNGDVSAVSIVQDNTSATVTVTDDASIAQLTALSDALDDGNTLSILQFQMKLPICLDCLLGRITGI